MNILGISAYYHDSAACLVQDGEVDQDTCFNCRSTRETNL